MYYKYPNDEVLLKDFKSGKKDAYEYIFRNFSGLMYNYGFKICHDSAMTKDAMQDVFLKILTHYQKINIVSSLKLYLFKALRNEIFKRLNIDNRMVECNSCYDDFNLDYSAEEKIIEDEITMIRIKELSYVVQELPRRQKECIYLRYYEAMSYQEIAEIMDIEISSVYKMLYKAIEQLYDKLAMKNGNLFY